MVTNMQNNYHDKFMKKVGAKVSASMKDLAKTGNRNLRGVQFSAHRIIKSAENLFFQFGSQQYSDPVEAIYKGFSERPGLSNVNNIAGIDVVDINIQATQQSVLGYISAERALDKPIDTLWFQGLKALNTVGGYEKGAWVNRPYMPMKNAIRNAVRGAFAEVKDLSSPIDLSTLPGKDGQVLMETLQIVNKDGKTVGKYVDGEVYFNDGATSAKLEGTVLTVNGAAAGYKLVVGIDKTTERDGKNTLKLKPATETINVTAQPRRIALEQSYEDNAYINKQAYELSQSGLVQDYGRMAVNQLLDTYVKFLDFDSVMTTFETVTGFAESETMDMTDYILTTSDADTKNDILAQRIIGLNKDLQKACGFGYSALLVDTEAAAILGNSPKFVANPAFNQTLDGLIGNFLGTPVIRHHALDYAFDTEEEQFGVILGIYKAADGSLAPTVYAEYLPPYSATPALNFDNAAQYSTSLLSMSACKAISEDADVQLGTWMKIRLAKKN